MRRSKRMQVVNLADDSFVDGGVEIVDLTETDPEVSVLAEIGNVGKLSKSGTATYVSCYDSIYNKASSSSCSGISPQRTNRNSQKGAIGNSTSSLNRLSANVDNILRRVRNEKSTFPFTSKKEERNQISSDTQILNIATNCDNLNDSVYSISSTSTLGGTTPRTTRNSRKSATVNLSSELPTTRSIGDREIKIVKIVRKDLRSSPDKSHCFSVNTCGGKVSFANMQSFGTGSGKKIKRQNSPSKKKSSYITKAEKKRRKSKGYVDEYYKGLETALKKTQKHNKNKKQPIPEICTSNNQKSQKANKISKKMRKKFKALERASNNKLSLSKSPKRTRFDHDSNIFNPNPYEPDRDGLRPVIIDGSNIAFGHGRGRFSPKGIMICVNFFALKGHDEIKVFLPLFRQEQIPKDELESLETKCSMIFTPSRTVDGVTRSSYDDRFIIQYAFEVGGVIVSNDNYRDLLKENPLWKDTIMKRHLMFTWADDVLMFPMDPFGQKGPTLDELLRF